MNTIPATEAKNRFGELLEAVGHEPVGIARNGRAVAVMLSAQDYSAMQKKILEADRPTSFDGLVSWRKSAKKRKQVKAIAESDYLEHLTRKYGR